MHLFTIKKHKSILSVNLKFKALFQPRKTCAPDALKYYYFNLYPIHTYRNNNIYLINQELYQYAVYNIILD